MPTDTRRNLGPDNSENYLLYNKENKNYAERLKFFVGKDGVRSDGRKLNEHRKIYMKTGIVTHAKGSAYVEYNKTKVIVSVFEPREIPRLSEFSPLGELYCEIKFAPFSCPERRAHIMDAEEKDLSGILKRALEPAVCRHEFPNFQVEIYVYVLENDGSCLSATITAAGLALADASIPMYDIITSVSIGIHDDYIIVDPSLEEENLCKTPVMKDSSQCFAYGIITLSYLGKDEQISELSQIGAMSVNQISESIDILISVCNEISILSKQCLVGNVKQKLEEEKKDPLK